MGPVIPENSKTVVKTSRYIFLSIIAIFIGAILLLLIISNSFKQNKEPHLPVSYGTKPSLATDYESCRSSKGALISATLTSTVYADGQSPTDASIPECTMTYNSSDNFDLYQQCIRLYDSGSATGMLNRNSPEKCYLDFHADPIDLHAIIHPAISLVFHNQTKKFIDDFLYYQNILIVGVQKEGIYGKNITENKQLWFYKTNNFISNSIINDTNRTIVTNIGGNDNFKLVALDVLIGNELWNYENSFFYPPYSVENGNIRIKIFPKEVPKEGQLIRTILLNGDNGTIIEDNNIVDESWGKTIVLVFEYANVIIKRDFDKIFAIDKQTKELVWEIKLNVENSYSYVSSKNIVEINSKDILLVPTGNFIYAIDPNAGKLLWTFCSRSTFRYSKIGETQIVFEAPDKNLYSLDVSKINRGETIDLFPDSPGLSCN